MCFDDCASAFDSVDRDSLWRIMTAVGMPPKLLRLIKAYYALTKMKVRASGSDSIPFENSSGVRQGCALSPTLFNSIIDWILGQVLQDYPGVQVGANVHVSDLAYADDIVILSSSYREMQGLLEAANHHSAAVGIRIKASNTNAMSELIRGELCQAALPHGEPLEDFNRLKYLGSMFVANSQGTEEIRNRINLARSAVPRLQSCL